MNIDFHVHGLLSKRKDFNHRMLLEEIEVAKQNNLDGFILCEHFNAINFLELHKYLKENFIYEGDRYNIDGFYIFCGMEVNIKNKGHVIIAGNREDILFLHHDLLPYMIRPNYIEFKDLLDLADKYNCLKIGAHPYRKGHKLYTHPIELLKRLDALDLNAKDIFNKGELTVTEEVNYLSKLINVNVVTGSDSHTPLQLGSNMTSFEEDCLTISDLRSAINKGLYKIQISKSLEFKVYTSKILKRYIIKNVDYDKYTIFHI